MFAHRPQDAFDKVLGRLEKVLVLLEQKFGAEVVQELKDALHGDSEAEHPSIVDYAAVRHVHDICLMVHHRL